MEAQHVSTDDDRSTWFKIVSTPRPLAGRNEIIRAVISYDNECKNKYPHFSITADLYGQHRYLGEPSIRWSDRTYWMCGGGCMHEQISEAFPEVAPLVRWHLCDLDGPMHYVANGSYWHKLWGDSIAGHPWDTSDAVRTYGTEKLRAFFSDAVLHGELEGDPPLEELVTWYEEDLKEWLVSRQPALRTKFLAILETARQLKGKI